MIRPGKKKGSDGLAIIMVLVMVIIFSSLILAVIISSTTAIRRAHHYSDKATALEIAEAGIQDVLYWMNYKGYHTENYPQSSNPFFCGSETGDWKNDKLAAIFNPTNIPGAKCSVRMELTGDINSDTIISTGSYRGRSATISVALKGANTEGEKLKHYLQGISEALNKKTVYSDIVNLYTPISPGINIKGNITTSTPKPSPFPSSWTQATWTETDTIPDDIVRFETEVCHFTTPNPALDPDTDADTDTYNNVGNLVNATYPLGYPVNNLDNGVYWDGTQYLFGRTKDGLNPEDFSSAGKNIIVEASAEVPPNAGNIIINGYFKSTEDISINKSITTATNGSVFHVGPGKSFTIAAGHTITGSLAVRGADLNLNGNTITETAICTNDINISGTSQTQITHDMVSQGKITIDGPIAINNGDIVANGDITISDPTTVLDGNLLSHGSITVGANLIINGCIVASGEFPPKNHEIRFTGGAHTINATGSLYDAAIIVHPFNSGGVTGNINISRPVTITIGENQKAAILVCAVNGTVNISNPSIEITFAKDPPDQFAIVNFSGASSNVNINANNFFLRGSIYSYKNITLNDNTQTITGILIAGGALAIGNSSTIIYEPGAYRNSWEYKGFVGGRRRYVPVPGSWEVKW